jgi:uncharacterized protein
MNTKKIVALVALIGLTGTSCWPAASDNRAATRKRAATRMLLHAARSGNIDDLAQALAERPDVHAVDDALRYAIVNDDAQAVQALLNAGADANETYKDGVTALMVAAINNSPHAARALLNAGANINTPDAKGKTALEIAILFDSVAVVPILQNWVPIGG